MGLFKKEFEKCKYCDWYVGHDEHCYVVKKCKHLFAEAGTPPIEIKIDFPFGQFKIAPTIHYIICVKCKYFKMELCQEGKGALKGTL